MTFVHPHLLALLPVLWIVVILLELRVAAGRRRRVLRTIVRALLLSALLLAVARPERTEWRRLERRLVIAVDRSARMGLPAREEALEEARAAAAEARAAGASVSLLGFGEDAAPAFELSAAVAGDAQPGWPEGPGGAWPLPAPQARATPVPEPPHTQRARPAAALAAAHLAFRPGERGSVVLLTSGHGGMRGVAEAARELAAAGIRLRAVALPREVPPPPPSLEVGELDLPDTVRGPFTVRAVLKGDGPLDAELLVDGVSQGHRMLPAAAPGSTGAAALYEDLVAPVGVHEIALVLRRLGQTDAAGAVLARRLLTVEPPPRTLALLEDAATSPTRRALEAQGFPLETVPPEALERVLQTPFPPEAIVLDAASAARLPASAQRALAQAVEGGVGLFLEPGTDEEAWSALADQVLARLLPLQPIRPPPPEPDPLPPPPATPEGPDVEPPEKTDGPGLEAERRPEEALPISLLLVLDRSGSMLGSKFAMALEGARRAAGTLSEFDRLGIVTFAEDASLDVPMTRVRRLGNLAWRLALIQPAGNTDLYGALDKAAAVMARETSPIRHVIFLTDGRQTGREPIFGPLMKEMAKAGVTLTAVGLGPDHDGRRLKQIVQFSPRGRYLPVDSERQLPTILTRDTQEVADYRLREAEALAPPIREPDQTPQPSEEDLPPAPPTPPTPPTPEAPPPPPPEPVETLARLHLLRPHEATRGIDETMLPSVGAPRPSRPLRGAALLVARGDDGQPVLAARRVGLGRVLAFALPPDVRGLAAWPDLTRILVQGVRSVRAPRGALGGTPAGRVLTGPDGDRLALDGSPNPDAAPVGVTWTGSEGVVDLGRHRPGAEVDLPAAAPGTAALVQLAPTDGARPPPPLTYLAADPARADLQAGDAAALGAAIGPTAAAPGEPLLPAPGREPAPLPLWPFCLVLAALLFPIDAALHRRTGEGGAP